MHEVSVGAAGKVVKLAGAVVVWVLLTGRATTLLRLPHAAEGGEGG
jgi:hypothetical protein